jgi:hypothetical protein
VNSWQYFGFINPSQTFLNPSFLINSRKAAINAQQLAAKMIVDKKTKK